MSAEARTYLADLLHIIYMLDYEDAWTSKEWNQYKHLRQEVDHLVVMLGNNVPKFNSYDELVTLYKRRDK